jgi:hypothetical protein
MHDLIASTPLPITWEGKDAVKRTITPISSNLLFTIQTVGIFIKNVVGFSDAIFLPAVTRAQETFQARF